MQKDICEFEAEAVAWIVAARAGIETKSADYLASRVAPLDNERVDIDAVLQAANHIESLAPTKALKLLRVDDRNAALGWHDNETLAVPTSPSFDEKTYKQALPHFKKAAAHFMKAGSDTATAMQGLVDYMVDKLGVTRDQLMKMKPYVIRFVKDMRSGAISLKPEPTLEP